MKKTSSLSLSFLIISAVFLTIFLFSLSCGLIARMGSETPIEKKITAEFKLAGLKGSKILVLVKQPSWLGAPLVLQQMLSERIAVDLKEKAKISSSNIIPFKELSEFRSKEAAYIEMTEAAVGKKLLADVVLVIMLESYEMINLAESDLYKSALLGRAVLIKTEDGKILWPEQEGKAISVGFDMQQGQQAALKRLSESFSHCLTRYLYDCPYRKFKTADDRGTVGWGDWENL